MCEGIAGPTLNLQDGKASTTKLQINGFGEERKSLCREWHLLAATNTCRYIWNCNHIDLFFIPEKSMSEPVSLVLPETVVDGSARAYFSVLGK